MAGIYIHIPFCKQACHYCNFHFSTTNNSLPLVIEAIEKEILLAKNYLNDEIVDTIYFGGGTPSLLSENHLQLLLNALKNNFEVNPIAEVTLEANPDDMTIVNLKQWFKNGINRLSVGTQSFFDKDLKWMNRAHNAQQAINSIKTAHQVGFDNMSIDLIYGLPESNLDEWEINLSQAFDLNVSHLSCYSLTVEPKTALQHFIATGKSKPVNEDQAALQFEYLMEAASKNGYEHYEISNFAKPNMRSKHNSSYWSGKKYLGIGPSAHSYNGNSRQWNVANNHLYVQSINENKIPFELEILSPAQSYNEFVMIRLRTKEGIAFNELKEKHKSFSNYFEQLAQSFTDENLIEIKSENYSLTQKGKLLADHIMSELMWVEN